MPAEDERERLHKVGQGNWRAFRDAGMKLDDLLTIASGWAENFRGVEKGWLCWNVDSDWCLVQQQLAESVGWTPIVGYDPRVGPPDVIRSAILVDFNKDLKLPVMYPHFPLELAFRFIDRIAFWHSDLLVRKPKLDRLAHLFESVPDGVTVATRPFDGWREYVSKKKTRYWELIGCTTRAASRNQFECGAGWWMNFHLHPNCPDDDERARRAKHYWDHGTGIYYWHKRCGGKVEVVPASHVNEGHFTKINNPNYVRSHPRREDAQRHMSVDLRQNFDLAEICRKLDLQEFLTVTR